MLDLDQACVMSVHLLFFTSLASLLGTCGSRREAHSLMRHRAEACSLFGTPFRHSVTQLVYSAGIGFRPGAEILAGSMGPCFVGSNLGCCLYSPLCDCCTYLASCHACPLRFRATISGRLITAQLVPFPMNRFIHVPSALIYRVLHCQ